jgi:hypothetical protein
MLSRTPRGEVHRLKTPRNKNMTSLNQRTFGVRAALCVRTRQNFPTRMERETEPRATGGA